MCTDAGSLASTGDPVSYAQSQVDNAPFLIASVVWGWPEWLGANARFMLTQTELMADLDAAVIQESSRKALLLSQAAAQPAVPVDVQEEKAMDKKAAVESKGQDEDDERPRTRDVPQYFVLPAQDPPPEPVEVSSAMMLVRQDEQVWNLAMQWQRFQSVKVVF